MANDGVPGPKRRPGWYSRGYHPHFDGPMVVQSVGFRLADSVPRHLLKRWRQEAEETDPELDKARAVRLERLVSRFEDTGYGACHLRRPAVARLVQDSLLHADGDRYRLIDWCVMPNHVHVLVEPLRTPLPDIVRMWKSTTARQANQLLGRSGPFWMRDYYDRFIRDARHLEAVRRYIWLNPVHAGLCVEATDWPWSSAHLSVRESGMSVRLSVRRPSGRLEGGAAKR